jgi:hypothetical protein
MELCTDLRRADILWKAVAEKAGLKNRTDFSHEKILFSFLDRLRESARIPRPFSARHLFNGIPLLPQSSASAPLKDKTAVSLPINVPPGKLSPGAESLWIYPFGCLWIFYCHSNIRIFTGSSQPKIMGPMNAQTTTKAATHPLEIQLA